MITLFNNKKKLHSLLKTTDGREVAIQVTFLNNLRQKLEHQKKNLKDNDTYLCEVEADIKKIDGCIAELEQQTFTPQQH